VGYQLGVDLGTTFTAAALVRDGRVELVSLGDRTLEIPSVAFAREDGVLLVGDAALRRGPTQPSRFAREFKRRLGDHAPVLLGGVPYSPEALLSELVRHVVTEVREREGSDADWVTLTYPANWGPYKRELFEQTIQLSDLGRVSTATEPAAAAVHFASTTRVAPDDVVALYDLGGGTFDAAVLRKTEGGFELLGRPEGIEHLGGVDFDEAVFRFVTNALGERFASLDRDDSAFRPGIARLRQECVEAKESLSSDTETSVSVALPGLHTEVRLTRSEFEGLIRPLLQTTVLALGRAMRSADIEPSDVTVAVLAGGSSRIPLIAELIRSELELPVSISSHPKHAVALGAAHLAAHDAAASPAARPDHGQSAAEIWAPPVPVAPAEPPLTEAPPRAAAEPVPLTTPVVDPRPPTPPPAPTDPSPPPPLAPSPATPSPASAAAPPRPPKRPRAQRPGSRRKLLIGAIAALLAIAAAVAAVVVATGSDDDGGDEPVATAALDHPDQVFAVAFTPDGNRLATGGADATIRLWDPLDTEEPIATLEGHEDWVTALAFSSDSATLASGSDDTTIKRWDVEAGEYLDQVAFFSSYVTSAVYAPNGTILAGSSGEGDGVVTLLDPESGELIRSLEGFPDLVEGLSFSPDGGSIAGAGSDGTVWVWDVQSGELRAELTGHTDWVTSVAYSSDGTRIASGSGDGTVRLWDAQAAEEIQTLEGPEGEVLAVAFSPDGSTIASGGADGTVLLWDSADGELIETLTGHTSAVQSLAFSPDGATLASASDDHTVRLWDLS